MPANRAAAWLVALRVLLMLAIALVTLAVAGVVLGLEPRALPVLAIAVGGVTYVLIAPPGGRR